jgi:hypothetical protein
MFALNSLASRTEEGTYHGGTETRRRDGVNLRRFLGRNHAQISAIVLLEWDRSMAEFEKTELLSLPYKQFVQI